MNDACKDRLNLSATPVLTQTEQCFSSFQHDLNTLQNIIQQFDQAVVIVTQSQQFLCNPPFAQLFGHDQLQQFEIEDFIGLIHSDDHEPFIQVWEKAKTGEKVKHHCRIQHAQFGHQFCQLSIHHLQSNPLNLEWIIQIHNQQESYSKENKLTENNYIQKQMLDGSLDCIKILSLKGDILELNRAGCLSLGISAYQHKFGMSWLNFLPEEHYAEAEHALSLVSQGEPSSFSSMTQFATQPTRYWQHLLTPIFNHQSEVEKILCISRDITKQRQAELRLQHVLEIDELTGLYNRRTFNRTFKEVLQAAQRSQQQIGLLLIDLDYFKHVNDTFGHIAGDHLLSTLGKRFKHCFDERVIVARLGGDEFAVLIPHLNDEEELFEIAHQANQQLDYSISYAGQPLNGGMSIGCSMYPRDAKNTSNLLKCADIALNDLKNSGRGGIRVFNKAMFNALEDITRQLALARSIIKSNRIVPYYQPKVCLSSNAVIGFEALLRWRDDQDKIQAPVHIMAAFQDYDLATRISETMQTKIFQDLNQWLAQGLDILPVSINAAPVEFLRDDYAEQLLSRLAQFNIPHHKIEVEITEQSLAEGGSDYVIRALNLLKKSGVHISLDDFGTGHSSLTRLRDYPVDCIKIDRNFVEHLHNDPSALAIIKAITQIGSSISLDILVEGIENIQQLDTLKECDCRIGQGFYFYRPMNFDNITPLLQPHA